MGNYSLTSCPVPKLTVDLVTYRLINLNYMAHRAYSDHWLVANAQ